MFKYLSIICKWWYWPYFTELFYFLVCSEFKLIHELCLYVLSASKRPALIRATLSALHAYLSWIPLPYIFQSPLVIYLEYKWNKKGLTSLTMKIDLITVTELVTCSWKPSLRSSLCRHTGISLFNVCQRYAGL